MTPKKRYREVKTKLDMEKFDHAWMDICNEKGATFIPYHPNSTRYFILDGNGNDVGTIEFTKRNPNTFSICEQYFDFANHPKVSKNENEIVEVGKISIIINSRGEGYVDNLLYLLMDYAEKHGSKQYLAYMNKDFLHVLQMGYGLNLDILGEEIVQEKHIGIPIMCNIKEQVPLLVSKGLVHATAVSNH